MFKKATLERVQYAVNMAATIIGQQEEQAAVRAGATGKPMQGYAERQQNTLALATLLLEEDDRQSKTIIIPPRGA